MLYLVFRIAGIPLLVLYFLYRGWRDRRYFQRFGERLGRLPASFKRTASGSIWLHAVSVGEVLASVILLRELRNSVPHLPLYLSTTTLAGREIAMQKAAGLADGIFFAPLDYGFAVRSVIRAIRPAVVVVLETEIWPVLYHEAKRAGCSLLVLNGRISDRALPRYQRFRWAFGPVLGLADSLFVQSERDRERYLGLGAPPSKLTVAGNLKYDAAPSQGAPPESLTKLLPATVWIAASTMPGLDSNDLDEDEAVIAAFGELAQWHPRLLLVLAPRRPERFATAASKLRDAGVRFIRRSRGGACELPCVYLLDSIGELASVFPLADAVFMGGTLAKRGGHNVLEPAVCARAIVVGPHMENFSSIADEFRAAHAWLEIAGPGELASAVDRLLTDPARRKQLGERAASLAVKNTGAAARGAAEILRLRDRAVPVFRNPFPWTLLTRILQASSAFRPRAQRLETPVISVGGISMGGTGKTPFVELLARSLANRGVRPAILTRGYKRQSREPVIVRAGEPVPVTKTGDEAQIFVRSGVAHVGIGADRFRIGQEMEKQLHPDVFLLDDGFQHWRMQRSLDIVLIDSLNPFPPGRMRERVPSLARAHVLVITRAERGRSYEGLREILHRANPNAPVFLAHVEASRWMPSEPPAGPVAAFCGLGNPDTFWNTLRELGLQPIHRWTFRDHHRYSAGEIERMRGPWTLLTTEKDAMNLPDGTEGVFWLKVETVLSDPEALMALLPVR